MIIYNVIKYVSMYHISYILTGKENNGYIKIIFKYDNILKS